MAASDNGSSRTRLLLGGATWQAAAQVLPLILNIVLTPFLLHGFGTARYGLFLMINTLSMLMAVFDGGIGQSSMRYFTLYAGSQDKRATTRLLGTLVALMAGITLVVLTLIFLLQQQALRFFKVSDALLPEGTFLLHSLTVIVGCLLLRQPFQGVLFAHHRYRVVSTAILVGHVIWAVGSVLSVVRGWNLYGVAATFATQQVVSTLIIVPASVRLLDRRGLGWLGKAELADFFRYAWKVQVSGVTNLLMSQKDPLVAGRLLGAEVSAPFGQGVSFSQQLRLLPMNALAPIQSVIGQLVGGVGPRAAVNEFVRLQRLWVIGVTGWCAVGVPASFYAVHAWVPQLPIAGDVAAILVAGQLWALLPAVLIVWALTLGHPELDLRFSVGTLAVSVAFTAALVPFIGAIGSVMATATANLVGSVLLDRTARRVLPFPVRSFFREVPVVAALVGAALTVGLEHLVQPVLPRGAPGLVLGGLVGAPGLAVFGLIAVGPATLKQLWKARVTTV